MATAAPRSGRKYRRTLRQTKYLLGAGLCPAPNFLCIIDTFQKNQRDSPPAGRPHPTDSAASTPLSCSMSPPSSRGPIGLFAHALFVDLGYGFDARPTRESAARSRRVHPDA